MKCIIDNQVILSQAPEGPLAPHIGPLNEAATRSP